MFNIISSISSSFSHKILLSRRHPLNIDSLKQVKNKWENLGLDEGMGNCFQVVMENFPKEPPWVMKNAQMDLKGDDGKVLSFASGKKEWKINVSAGDYHYHITAPSKSAYLARLCFQQQPLSIRHFKKVAKDLETWGLLTPAEMSCFTMVLQKFSQKPFYIQSNAQIKFILDIDGENVEFLFISGNGDYKMNVTHSNGQPQYHELFVSSSSNIEGLSCSMQTLNVDHLRELQNELAQRDLLTNNITLCFNYLVDKSLEFSKLFGENLQFNFTCNKQGLSLISQNEEWEVTVESHDEKVDAKVKVHTWGLFWKQNKGKTHMLTTKNLEETQAELRTLRGTPRCILDKFNKALSIFSQEFPCFKKNARLVIECDQGEMVFISGKGENKIDIFHFEGGISYTVRRTWKLNVLRAIYEDFGKAVVSVILLLVKIVTHFV